MSYRVICVGTRVAIVRTTPEGQFISEMDVDQADIMLVQMQIAVATAIEALRRQASRHVAEAV